MKKFFVAISTLGLLSFAMGMVPASAQTVPACNGNTFETFATGTVNGQGGWHVINSNLDQEVVPNTLGFPVFGCKSLRISNATTSTFIFNQLFSPSIPNEAGETGALDSNGAPLAGSHPTRFEAQFDLASFSPDEQPGMHLSVSPDRADGTRMSALGFVDAASGIEVFFQDVQGTSSPTAANFVETPIAVGGNALSRAVPHVIKFMMDFVNGPSNDIVKIFIDGNLVHTGKSWEDFHRFDAEAFPSPTNTSRTVRSLVFYEQAPGMPANLGKGFLIDNVFLSATTTPTGTTTPPVSTTTPPTITLNGSSTINHTINTPFVDPGATAVDSASSSITVVATGTVNVAVLGAYILTYTATDTNSNVASTTRTVNVVPAPVSTSTPPVITLNGSSTIDVLVNSIFTDPGATAIDSASSSVAVTATGTVNTAVLGNYTLIYTATDTNSNTASTTRLIRVVEAGPLTASSSRPIITLNGSSSINVTQNTAFTDPGATARDAIGGSVPVVATGTVNTAVVGDYTILYTATDTANNTSTTTRAVHVVTAPVTPPVTPPVVVSSGGGGGGSGGLYYPPVPGMPGFVFAPLPGQSTTGTVGLPGSSISIGQITPLGQVLGTTVFNFTRNLRLGSRGVDVTELQRFLISKGFLVLANPTQYFGPLTRAALVRWQASVGLPATGFFGPLSRAEILK